MVVGPRNKYWTANHLHRIRINQHTGYGGCTGVWKLPLYEYDAKTFYAILPRTGNNVLLLGFQQKSLLIKTRITYLSCSFRWAGRPKVKKREELCLQTKPQKRNYIFFSIRIADQITLVQPMGSLGRSRKPSFTWWPIGCTLYISLQKNTNCTAYSYWNYCQDCNHNTWPYQTH